MLNEKGIPTPLVHCMMSPPKSRMDVLTDAEINTIVSHSKITAKYNQAIDNQSACEILTDKLNNAAQQEDQEKQSAQQAKQEKRTTTKEKGFFDDPTVKQVERTA